jgi:hypothetical protein
MSDTLRKGHEHCILAPCTTKVLKWGAVLYVAHWVLHGVALIVAPVFGVWLLALL